MGYRPGQVYWIDDKKYVFVPQGLSRNGDDLPPMLVETVVAQNAKFQKQLQKHLSPAAKVLLEESNGTCIVSRSNTTFKVVLFLKPGDQIVHVDNWPIVASPTDGN